ncbi:hypothetical protein Dimus_024919, partial [Dionaea muscipula]
MRIPCSPPRPPRSELFADNKKPCVDHRLHKIGFDVPTLPNGSLDLSNGFETGLFTKLRLVRSVPSVVFLPPLVRDLLGTLGVPMEFQRSSVWVDCFPIPQLSMTCFVFCN